MSVGKNVIHPELSYKIVGILYDVYNTLGPGYREKYYEKAVAKAFDTENIHYKQQLHVPLLFKGEKIGDDYIDFLVEDTIVVELKRGDIVPRNSIEQVYEYLRAENKKLGIIAQFTSKGVLTKRIVNEH